jgi:hypothetical protein
MAEAYEPSQFHVSRNGLALLANYVLHLIDIGTPRFRPNLGRYV